MSLVTGSTFSGKNIATILLLTSYTIITPGKYTFQVYLDACAGGGDYVLNARRKFGGVGQDYPLVPKTTFTAAAADKAFGFSSIGVECNTNDLLSFYCLGLAGDTAVTGTAYIYLDDWVRSTTPANTFDVSATGEGGLDFNNIKNATGATTLTNITVPVATSVGNVTGNVNGSVASVTNPVTAGTVSDKTGYALSATGVDAIIDEIIEGTLTLRQSLRIIYAVLFGKSTGGGTVNVTFRDIGDAKPRVTAVVDANGNRTSMTTDGTP